MDPLSDVLSLLKPRSYISAGLDAADDWSLRFGSYEGIKFNGVTRGECWLRLEGEETLYPLKAGDCFLLTRGHPFILTTDLARTPMDAQPLFEESLSYIATCNRGGEFTMVSSRFIFDGTGVEALLGPLPAVVLVRAASTQAPILQWALMRIQDELVQAQPGSALLADHLAHIMLVEVLRLYLQTHADNGVGWLYALFDQRIGGAISAMHANPAGRWTVAELATLAKMSRSTFALRFRQMTGVTPLEYLTRWRMQLAAEKLLTGKETLAAIALSIGYESESAFSSAFKRVMTLSPLQYKRQSRG